MSRTDEVRSAMVAAMKSKDKDRKDALSMLLAALKQKEIDKREPLTEEEENAVVMREIKQTQETIETAPPDRQELIAQSKAKIEVYREYAPKQMGEDELRQIIAAVFAELGIAVPLAKDKGVIMQKLMPQVKGKCDGALVNRLVGELLK